MSTILTFEEFARFVASPPKPLDESWQPAFVQLTPGEAECFPTLCRERRIAVVDAIDRQLTDLAFVRFPSEAARLDRDSFIQ